MISWSVALATSLEADAHAAIPRLVDIELTSGTLYRTDHNESIVYGGNTYVADTLSFGAIKATTAQESPRVALKLQNIAHPTSGAGRPWSTVINAEDVNGVRVTVRLYHLTEGQVLAEEDWAISGPRLAGDDVQLPIGPLHDIYQLETPWPRLKQPRCTHEYKDEGCASQSTLKTCPGKTIQECIARHNALALRISQLPIHDRSLYRRRA